MKILTLAALFILGQAPNVYPVGYRIEAVHSTKHLFTSSGYGQGDIRDEHGIRGFDFQFKFCQEFQPTHGPGFGPSRWESPHRLVIVTQEIGSDRGRECTLEVTLRDFAYGIKNGQLVTIPLR